MAKSRMTYAISQEAIDALREMAHQRTLASGVRVAAGTVLEELILKAAGKPLTVLNKDIESKPVKGKREWGTASQKEGRAIVKPVGQNLFDTSNLDDVINED
jgi:hypothetical protein